MLYDAQMRPTLLLPKVKDKIFVIVSTISPFGSHPKGLFLFHHLKIKIMKTLDINTIAFQYLLRTESPIQEEQIIEFNQEKYLDSQNSLLVQLYNLEEEDLYVQSQFNN